MDLGLILNIEPNVIMGFMDPILETVYNSAENTELQEWGHNVIVDLAERIQSQIIGILGYDPTGIL